MIADKTLQFLADLKENNTREWFDANRDYYQESRKDFNAYAQVLLNGLEKQDPAIASAQLAIKNCVFRINRDVRFSNDKSPYKSNFGAFFTPGGKNGGRAGYYLHLEPGVCFLAGGMYMPDAQTLKLVRQEIDYSFKDFSEIFSDKSFKKFFPNGMDKESVLKKAPSGYSVEHPAIEYLRFKSFTVSHDMEADFLTKAGATEYILHAYAVMQPFNAFLNQALII
ncbi:MAG: DUF2461 domain-containing protein [Bacteroidota bacterium]